MTGVFQALVVVGLFLLTAVVGVATFVMVRRGHNDNTREQPGAAHPTVLTLPSSSGSAGEPRGQIGPSDAGAGEQESSDAELDDLRAKAKTLLASAQTARAEAEEESRARRTELRELRADLERREQRLSDREERLDSDVRGLEDKTSQLEELKNELKNQRRMLADLETQQQLTLERIAGMTAEQAKSELVAAVTHDAKRQAVLVARDIERQATREADARAQTIIVGAIQRLASELTSESVVSAVHLPGDDMRREDALQPRLVLGLQQRFERSCWQLRKRLVGRRKYREGPGSLQCLDEVGRLECLRQRLERSRRHRGIDDVLVSGRSTHVGGGAGDGHGGHDSCNHLLHLFCSVIELTS